MFRFSNNILVVRRLFIVLSLMALSLLPGCDGNRLVPKSRRNGASDSVLEPGRKWELIGSGFQLTADSAVDSRGVVYFTDAQTSRILKIDLAGKISVWKEGTGKAHGAAIGADGRLYAGQHDLQRIVAFSSDGREVTVIAEGVQTHHLIVTADNRIYFSEAPKHQIGLIDGDGTNHVATSEVNWPHGLHVVMGRSQLIVTDSMSGDVWSFEIQADGTLNHRKPFCTLESNGPRSEIDPGGIASDSAGNLYIATHTGIQICDSSGSVMEIVSPPGNGGVTNVFFAGPDLRWLYATDGEQMFRLQLKRGGSR